MYEIVKVQKGIETTKNPFDYVQGHVSLTSLAPFLIFIFVQYVLVPVSLISSEDHPHLPTHPTLCRLSLSL